MMLKRMMCGILSAAMLTASLPMALAAEKCSVELSYTKSDDGYIVNGEYLYDVEVTDTISAIMAVYDEDGTLKQIQMKDIAVGSVDVKTQISNVIAEEGDEVKGMLWEKSALKPIAELEELKIKEISEETPSPAETVSPTVEPTETSVITLDRYNYPLVVGNADKITFADWETSGSSFVLTAQVNSDEYTASDIMWSVEDEELAYISDEAADGTSVTVHAKRTGFTNAVAALPNGDTVKCRLSVIDNVSRITVETVEFNTDELYMTAGDSTELIPIINPKDVFENGALNTNLEWSSSDENIVTVENGKVTAVADGTAEIKAVSADVGRTAVCKVTVNGTSADDISAGEARTMTVGDTLELDALSDGDVVWRSDNPSIADVDENGKVTAYSNSKKHILVDNPKYDAASTDPVKAPEKIVSFNEGEKQFEQGTVKVYATAKNGGRTAVYEISVNDRPVEVKGVSIADDSMVIAANNSEIVKAAVLPANAKDKRITWTSSNEEVAVIEETGLSAEELNQAKIKGVSAGTATITAECEGKSDSIEVTVTSDSVKVSTVTTENNIEIDLDEIYHIMSSVNSDADNKELAWITSDGSVVSVNNDGYIQGLSDGNATIYAVALDGVADTSVIEALQYERTLGEDNAEMTALLADTVYAECTVTVKKSSAYMRNLHISNESVLEDSVNVVWNADSKLDIGDMSYNVYVNGQLVDTVSTLGYTVNGLQPETTYTITVNAVGGDNAEDSVTVTTKARSEYVNVLDYGAKGDGRVMDTLAIQRAIDACPENGTVYLPKGYVFKTGALFLKSDMTFRVDGILFGSENPKDYPFIVTHWEGWRKVNEQGDEWANTGSVLPDNHYAHSSIINIGTYDEGKIGHIGDFNTENVVICGDGQINGNGFRLCYNQGPNQVLSGDGMVIPSSPGVDPTTRGRTITIHSANNIYIKDIQIAFGPSWTIHSMFSNNITLDNLDVITRGNGKSATTEDMVLLNADGYDPESSSNVNIFNCFFCTGDDAVSIKSGRNREGNELKRPTELLRLTDCQSVGSKSGFVIGSELASGARNILLQNLTIKDIKNTYGFWFKSSWSRGGLTENVIVRDITSSKPFALKMNYSSENNNPAQNPPEYRYITLENMNQKITFDGLEASGSREASYINNVIVRGVESGSVCYGYNFKIIDGNENAWALYVGSDNVKFYKSGYETDTAIQRINGSTAVFRVDNDAKTIKASDSATVAEVLLGIKSDCGGEQAYAITDSADVMMTDDAVISEGCKLVVTSEDKSASSTYVISVISSSDVTEQTYDLTTIVTEKTAMETYENNTVEFLGDTADNPIIICGNQENDYLDPSVGFHMNGKSASGKRYVAYTAPCDGTLRVTAKRVYSKAALYYATNASFFDGASIENLSGNAAWADGVIDVTAGNTYYLYCQNSGMEIKNIVFESALN